jgi:hypothetical protein
MMRVKQNMRTDRPHADKQSKLEGKKKKQSRTRRAITPSLAYQIISVGVGLDKEESPSNEPTRPNIDRTQKAIVSSNFWFPLVVSTHNYVQL